MSFEIYFSISMKNSHFEHEQCSFKILHKTLTKINHFGRTKQVEETRQYFMSFTHCLYTPLFNGDLISLTFVIRKVKLLISIRKDILLGLKGACLNSFRGVFRTSTRSKLEFFLSANFIENSSLDV